MRGKTLIVVLLVMGVGCGTTTSRDKGGGFGSATKTVDGLTRADIDIPGVLFIRDDHGLGSYDAFLIPEASISYRRRSRRLPEEMESAFMASLEQSLIDSAEEAEIPVVQAAGDCVLQVAMGLTDVEIERQTSRSVGRMTLVMEFRDTLSGEPLLRYATRNTIENEGTAAPRSEQIRGAFDRMVSEMDIASALNEAGLNNGTIRPECKGTLAERGAAVQPSVSAQMPSN
jgi:hypothetical protein